MEDATSVEGELDAISHSGPITFVHLAARVSVPECEADPTAARFVNVSLAQMTTARVIEWAQRNNRGIRVIYVSTGHVYAAPSVGDRVTEDHRTEPRSVYARTKLEAEGTLQELCAREEVPLLVARVFGLIAPDQAAHYVLPALIARVRERNVASVPGLDFTRDYLDARDVCDDLIALSSIVWPSSPTVVNVCSGIPVTIRELLEVVIDEVLPVTGNGLKPEIGPAPGRPGDIGWLVGNPSRYCDLTGLPSQQIPLMVTVRAAVAHGAC